MKSKFTKETIQIIAIIAGFFITTMIYFSPIINGKQLKQHDVVQFKGGAKEIVDFRADNNEEPLWTNSMFSGMPSYLLSTTYDNLIQNIPIVLRITHKNPHLIVFFCLVSMFFSLLILGVEKWQSILGAIFYAFSSYYFIILEAGHITKAISMIYAPAVVVSFYVTYSRKMILGAILFSLFLCLQIIANHLQITYYTFLILLVYGVFQAIWAFKNKVVYAKFIKPSLFLFVAAIIAFGANFAKLYHTYDYGKDSIRGKSELSTNQDDKTSGLDKSYATAWSYGIDETLTLLIPNFKGGSSHGELGEDSNVYKELKSRNIPNAKDIIKGLPLYWGTQSFTSGPVYIGAIVFFLFVFGLIAVRGRVKWWLLSATVLSITLAWGSNMMWLTDIFLDYFPGYNKFRTVSMILIIAELTMPLLGIIALKQFFEDEENRKENIKKLLQALYGVGGFLILTWMLVGGIYDFSSTVDIQLQSSGWPDFLIDALREDRKSMLTGDILRSLFFVIATFGLLFLYNLKKVKYSYVMLGLVALTLIDMWTVNKRYLNNDDFVSKRQAVDFQKTPADEYILKDTAPNYRVVNLTVSTFNDATTSYYHKSIGGYHGAKMRRYQELIEHNISVDLMPLQQIKQFVDNQTAKYMQEQQKSGAKTPSQIEVKNMIIDQMQPQINQMLKKSKSLNMLNTRYAIIDKYSKPIFNTNALGNAWFIQSITIVADADAEIAGLNDIDPAKQAVVDERFKDVVSAIEYRLDTNASIELTEYQPNHLKYKSSTTSDQLAIFSEVYYEKGWNAYVDGELKPHFRANYVLRGMNIPAGEHTIEFKFEPSSYTVGNIISLIFSSLLIILLVGYILLEAKKKNDMVVAE